VAPGVAEGVAVCGSRGAPCAPGAPGVGVAEGATMGVSNGANDTPTAAASVPAGRAERKARDWPSGDQRGELEDCGLVVNWRGGRLPSVAATQMFDCRRFCLWSIVVTT
jgi:hypothetical protein